MSTKRYRDGEKLQAAARAEMPAAAVRWLANVREPLQVLTMAALSPDVTDDEFATLVESFSESLPGMLEKIDHGAIAELLEKSMGAAMANGMAARQKRGEK